jgi:hypothetical protein
MIAFYAMIVRDAIGGFPSPAEAPKKAWPYRVAMAGIVWTVIASA